MEKVNKSKENPVPPKKLNYFDVLFSKEKFFDKDGNPITLTFKDFLKGRKLKHVHSEDKKLVGYDTVVTEPKQVKMIKDSTFVPGRYDKGFQKEDPNNIATYPPKENPNKIAARINAQKGKKTSYYYGNKHELSGKWDVKDSVVVIPEKKKALPIFEEESKDYYKKVEDSKKKNPYYLQEQVPTGNVGNVPTTNPKDKHKGGGYNKLSGAQHKKKEQGVKKISGFNKIKPLNSDFFRTLSKKGKK